MVSFRLSLEILFVFELEIETQSTVHLADKRNTPDEMTRPALEEESPAVV